MIFLVMYLLYVIIMYFNPRIGDFFIGKVDEWRKRGESNDGAVKEGTCRWEWVGARGEGWASLHTIVLHLT